MIICNEWCWHIKNKEDTLYGPFFSEEQAIDDAKRLLYDEKSATSSSIIIGNIVYPEFEHYIERIFDINIILDKADECFMNVENIKIDEEIFEIKTKRSIARHELFEAIEKWSKKHITSTTWIIGDETKEIIIGDNRNDNNK